METLLPQITPVNVASPVPLYFQVETDLRRLIAQGVLAHGGLVPPEQDLSRAYGVSRHTIRMALSRLAAEGAVSRTAGRGTFVTGEEGRQRFYLDQSFTRQMLEMGRVPGTQVLRATPGALGEAEAVSLNAAVGEPCFRLDRLRLGDDEPVGVQYLTLLTRRAPGIERHDFERQSVYEVLAREYGLVVTEIQHTVSADVADATLAGLLEIERGKPLLVVRTAAFVEPREQIELTTSYYRADRYEYGTTHKATF